jgi:hypothetical protein
MFHKAGSGKTISSLSILLSFRIDKKALIMCPASIRNTYGRDSNDMKTLFPTEAARHAWANNYEVKALADDPNSLEAYMRRLDDIAGEDEKMAYAKALFKGRIIIVDEAHNMIPLVRRYSDYMYDAFKSASKVILLTGTPILNQTSDWGVLMRLVSGDVTEATIPSEDVAFQQMFTSASLSRSLQFQLLNPVRNIVNFAVDLGAKSLPFVLSVAGVYASKLLAGTALDNLRAPAYELVGSNGTAIVVPQATGDVPDVVVPFLRPEDIYTTLVNTILLQQALNVIKAVSSGVARELPTIGARVVNAEIVNKFLFEMGRITTFRDQLDSKAIVEASKRYVSFFDYETAPIDPRGIKPSQSFPKKAFGPAIEVTLDDFQFARLVSVFVSKGSIYGRDAEYVTQTRKLLGLTEADSFEDLSTFKKYMPAISNLSADMLTFTTTKEGVDGDIMRDEYIRYRAVDRASGRAVKKFGVFGCDKFDKVVQLLRGIRNNAGGLFGSYAVQSGPGGYKKFTKPKPVKTPEARYLPIVYSNYDKNGLQLFSAYLDSIGEKHFVYLSTDSNIRRNYLEEECIVRRWNTGASEEPLCVLLHPSIRESLSFTHSPALICLEQIAGFGYQEQVHARILRKYNSDQNEEDRPVKLIFQVTSSTKSKGLDLKYKKRWYDVYIKEVGRNALAYQTLDSRMLPYEDNVESILVRDNDLQSQVFTQLADRFKNYSDMELADDCRRKDLCTPCIKGQCSDCTCKDLGPNQLE